jgi:hypothetical protein
MAVGSTLEQLPNVYVLRLTSLETLLMWIGFAAVWAIVSTALLRSSGSQPSGDRPGPS